MYAPLKTIKRNRNRRDDYGKSICVSIPFHKLDREEKMDEIVELEGWDSRSQMLLALVDKRYTAVKGGEFGSNVNTFIHRGDN